ncbi:sugar kinase [Actinomadura kijaniata]|uniref:Sugar/nucleoside kinase (Ribokinase family) n=1 Tax=Actinomadura namibiensis TaxID=182080 RepID=A0A7W3QMI6_ACTNM|nr:carbohydrate kinase family protein [Actinomadura namibiensis]MBA8952541.1 sugar/nucleoside kinase (ribokinase family) [Actinomadura namibiensis]
MHDVLVVGGAGIDTIVRVPELPVPFADSVAVPPIEEYVGHTGNGVALGCHALGLRARLIDFIGDDRHGRLIVEHHRQRGLAFSWQISPAGTRRAVNLVDGKGRRSSLYDARDVPDQRMPESFYRPFLENARHVHLSIVDYARHLLPDVRRLGLPVSTDLHDWDGENHHHRDFAYGCDIVFLSAARLGERVDAVLTGIVERGRAQVVVATDGERGGSFLRRGGTVQRFAAERGPVVDSNGAGDAFVSGFLFGHLTGRPPSECVRYGAIAGLHACGAAGTHRSLITADELMGRFADR